MDWFVGMNQTNYIWYLANVVGDLCKSHVACDTFNDRNGNMLTVETAALPVHRTTSSNCQNIKRLHGKKIIECVYFLFLLVGGGGFFQFATAIRIKCRILNRWHVFIYCDDARIFYLNCVRNMVNNLTVGGNATIHKNIYFNLEIPKKIYRCVFSIKSGLFIGFKFASLWNSMFSNK